MLKKAWRSPAILILCVFLLGVSIVGCGATGNAPAKDGEVAEGSNESDKAQPKKEKTVVDFWYLWTGVEAESLEKLIAEFNESQDSYEVKGLSVPDVQKIIVAISSGDGPDITDNFSNNTASYAEKGILLPLDEYIERDNYDLSDFIPAALETGKYNGKTYALPININFNMMFYNKKLFAEAGLTEPPKTDKELLEYAIKLTKVNEDKTLEVLGFPDYPLVYYLNSMSYALGGEFVSADGKLTPDNPGTIAAINLIKSYREKYGVDNVLKFNSSAKYLDATDPFVNGKQAIRFDGPWFGNTVKNVLKIDLDYGVAPLPGPEGKPELAGGGEVSSSTFFIAQNAKNKEGAWAFLSWLMSKPNMIKFADAFSNLPARISAYDDPAFDDMVDFDAFAEAAKSPNLKSFPGMSVQIEYNKLIGDEFELAANGKKTAEEAMKAAAEQANKLK